MNLIASPRRRIAALCLCAAALAAAGAKAASEERSIVERIAMALAEGERAEGRGGKAGTLAAASHFLAATGARPAEAGGPDLAAKWAEAARQRGADTPLPFRGRALGPAYRRGRVGPGGSLALEQIFLAGKKAEVALMPVRAARLVLQVSDGSGRVLCQQGAEDPPAKCGWLPVYTARHAVTIRNAGRTPADYYLVMN